MNVSFSGVSRDTAQGVETHVQVSRDSCLSGTDGDRISCGSLAQAQASARVDVPTAPHFFLQWRRTRSPTQHVCTSLICRENVSMCARPTPDRDLGSVIQDNKKEKTKKKQN